jgi:hypothetical protein
MPTVTVSAVNHHLARVDDALCIEAVLLESLLMKIDPTVLVYPVGCKQWLASTEASQLTML